MLLPTNAVAFAARSWDFFLVPNNFLWFQKIVGSQQMRMRICCSPLVFLFLFFCRIPRMAIFDSHSPAVRKGFLTRVKRRTKNRNYREFQISSRMEIRDSHDFSSRCAKPEKRAAVASCCWRRIFAARAFSQFCDFSISAISKQNQVIKVLNRVKTMVARVCMDPTRRILRFSGSILVKNEILDSKL